ncbi:hypothetical protein ACQJBY_062723 [Aegilops geniculata]
MEHLQDGHYVRLRSHVYGTYLRADEDGHGVSQGGRRASMNAAWVVHVYLPPDDYVPYGPYLRLHSAAYGRYLAATNVQAPRGLEVEQRGCEVEPIPWRAIRTESGDEVYLEHFYSGYLRAECNTGVSVDNVDRSQTMHWVVEPIPSTRRMPRLPLPPPPPAWLLHPPFFNRDVFLSREITCVWPNFEGALVNHDVFFFQGRSVFLLRHELARRLRVDVSQSQLAMCLPTRYGRFFPLVVDLPSNQQALIVVVVTAGTPAHAALRYADVDAE